MSGDGVFDAPDEDLNYPQILPALKDWSELLVDEALRRSGGKITEAAAMLGISQPALSKRLAKRELYDGISIT